MNSRRDFLGRNILATAAAGALIPLSQAIGQDRAATTDNSPLEKQPSPTLGPRRTYPIVLSTYSLWRFHNEELRDFDTCIDISNEMGFDGV